MEVNTVTYIFQYIEGVEKRQASKTLATNFCADQGIELLKPFIDEARSSIQENAGVGKPLSAEQKVQLELEEAQIYKEGCLEPISEALLQKINELTLKA